MAMLHIAARWFCTAAAGLAPALLLSACAVGPDFVHPAAPAITRYTTEPLSNRTSASDTPSGQAQHFAIGRDVPQEWWRMFRSRALSVLVGRAIANNPNLQSALASLRAAKEAVAAQRGRFFPLVQANFNPTLNRTSSALLPIPTSGASLYQLDTAQVIVSYTFDIWGLNRRTVESLQALADTQRFQVEAAYLTLVSNVVVAAITEASLRTQIDSTNQLIATNTKLVTSMRSRFQSGLINRSDLAVQEAALAQTKSTLAPLRKALAQERNLLATLTGTYPSEGPAETFKLDDLHLPEDLPLSLPSQLIEQRPDVRAAQEQLHSASAQVGVATANLLPSFTIDANAGFMNTALMNLLAPQNLFFTLAGNATQTVFDGGTLLHLLEQSKDNYNAAAWTYRGTVLTAVQNVADALRALQSDADALRSAREFERASKISFDLAQQQLQGGYANVLLQLNAQQSYLQSVLQVVQARAARLADTAALYQALGGGWWNRPELPAGKVLDVGTTATAPALVPPY